MKKFFTKRGNELHVIQTESLLAVEVNDYLCTFYMENGTSFHRIESLRKIHSELPDCFVRISRKCIVNTVHIKSIDFDKKEVELSGYKVFRFSVRNARTLRLLFSRK